MFEGLTLTGALAKGGFTIVILGLFSVASVAAMLERGWRFRNFRAETSMFHALFSRTVREGGIDGAAALPGSFNSPLAMVLRAGYSRRGKGTDEVTRAMELAARVELSSLERYLGVLGTIGSIAPFIGLFGTVLGIIRAFGALAAAEGMGPSVVADGIAEALVATAAGLFVAIPAVIAYNFFVRSLARCSLQLEATASEFVGELGGELGGEKP